MRMIGLLMTYALLVRSHSRFRRLRELSVDDGDFDRENRMPSDDICQFETGDWPTEEQRLRPRHSSDIDVDCGPVKIYSQGRKIR